MACGRSRRSGLNLLKAKGKRRKAKGERQKAKGERREALPLPFAFHLLPFAFNYAWLRSKIDRIRSAIQALEESRAISLPMATSLRRWSSPAARKRRRRTLVARLNFVSERRAISG